MHDAWAQSSMSGSAANIGGFTSAVTTRDQTSQALTFIEESIIRMKSGSEPPPLGLHLVLGPTFKEIIAGMRVNLAEGRLAPTIIHTRKN